jgi:hypothetical protein
MVFLSKNKSTSDQKRKEDEDCGSVLNTILATGLNDVSKRVLEEGLVY